MAAARSLILPASDYYLAALRAGTDPFQELARVADEMDFATCAVVELEVCRGLREPHVQRLFRARLACMVQQRFDAGTVEQSLCLTRAAGPGAPILPLPTVLVAACALQLGATLLTRDPRFNSIVGLQVLAALD
ncbi:MAG: hypothetical protein JNL39_00905 [Opitutaceae bacterium]|nr:hypothetical protein [Opitutaceae bacterium]